MAPGTTREQFRTMLQNLLIDRFQLATHRETREFPGHALLVAKNGPKFKEPPAASAPQDDGAPDPPLGKPGPDGFFAPPQRPGMFLQVTVAGVRSTFREFTMPGLAAVCRTS
jgi:uncharacterized protein (TIGR03435 family)